jgi:pimeloyl-ACP methyl ester carboxylesterase
MTQYFTHDGVRIAYEETGAAEPAMVFVHGWCCDRNHHAPQVAHLSPSHRCVSLDLRGHGDSDVPAGGYSIAVFADDVAALCSELGLHKPVIVGHSMGGAIALSVAARHPDLPSAIVMLDGAIFPPDSLLAMTGPLTAAFESDGYLEPLAGVFNGMFLPSDDAKLHEHVVAAALATPHHVAAGEWAALWANDYAGDAAKVRVPAMYVGAHNPIADMTKLRAAMPDAVLAQTAGAGHFHQLLVPEQVNAMIERFLAINGLG